MRSDEVYIHTLHDIVWWKDHLNPISACCAYSVYTVQLLLCDTGRALSQGATANAQAVANAIGSGNANAAAEAIASAQVFLIANFTYMRRLCSTDSCVPAFQGDWCVLLLSRPVALCRTPIPPMQQRKLWQRPTLEVRSHSNSCQSSSPECHMVPPRGTRQVNLSMVALRAARSCWPEGSR